MVAVQIGCRGMESPGVRASALHRHRARGLSRRVDCGERSSLLSVAPISSCASAARSGRAAGAYDSRGAAADELLGLDYPGVVGFCPLAGATTMTCPDDAGCPADDASAYQPRSPPYQTYSLGMRRRRSVCRSDLGIAGIEPPRVVVDRHRDGSRLDDGPEVRRVALVVNVLIGDGRERDGATLSAGADSDILDRRIDPPRYRH